MDKFNIIKNGSVSRNTGVRCFSEIFSAIQDVMENGTSFWRISGIVDAPKGERQPCDSEYFDHEFVDQRAGVCGDDYSGDSYFPVGDGRYIRVEYVC